MISIEQIQILQRKEREFHHLFTKENNMSEKFKENINHILTDILDIQL